jgi:anti-sigma B factor antagonist
VAQTQDRQPVVLTLPEEVDAANHAEVEEQIEAAFAPGVTVVIADLTGTKFCDSSGFRTLVTAHHDAADRGIQLRLVVTPGGAVSRMLDLLDLGRLLAIYPTPQAALGQPAAGAAEDVR